MIKAEAEVKSRKDRVSCLNTEKNNILKRIKSLEKDNEELKENLSTLKDRIDE